MAKRYGNRSFELIDLVQQGVIGLEKAVYIFEPGRDYKFSSYAFWWIRKKIGLYMTEDWGIKPTVIDYEIYGEIIEELTTTTEKEEEEKYTTNAYKVWEAAFKIHIFILIIYPFFLALSESSDKWEYVGNAIMIQLSVFLISSLIINDEY